LTVKSCLIHHPDTTGNIIKDVHIGVKALFQNGSLRLQYDLLGTINSLLIPETKAAEETTGLWEHTCFEAFVAIVDESPYHEFNFSPSGQWAAYAFDDYRKSRTWRIHSPPAFSYVCTNDRLSMEVVISEQDLPDNPKHNTYRLGLTAVLETKDGELSYWALCHPAGKPDFHHRTGFTLSF
jgi:hypothetical protein